MAMIDYGAIAFKNGECISTEMFTPMKKTCGFSDKNDSKSNLDGNYFVVCGDKELAIGFYKEQVAWTSNLSEWSECNGEEYFRSSNFHKWAYYRKLLYFNKVENDAIQERWVCAELTVKPKKDYYVARWNYKGDNYEVFFGYGVDLDFFKGTGALNYYHSFEYHFEQITYKITRLLKNLCQKRHK